MNHLNKTYEEIWREEQLKQTSEILHYVEAILKLQQLVNTLYSTLDRVEHELSAYKNPQENLHGC